MKAKHLNISSHKHELLEVAYSALPVAFYISDFNESDYDYIDWHWHKELQYCFVVEGIILFRINEEEYVVSAGNGIFINAKQIHTSKPLRSHAAIYYCFEFDPCLLSLDCAGVLYNTYVNPLIQNINFDCFCLSAEKEHHKNILDSILTIKQIIKQRTIGYEFDLLKEIISIFKNTLTEFVSSQDSLPTTRNENERLRKILDYIHQNYEKPLTLELIANSVHLSRSECSRYFKKFTGQPLFHYINQYRILKSKELLLETEQSISQIAVTVGFTSQSYYTECFRKQTSITPMQFRTLSQAPVSKRIL